MSASKETAYYKALRTAIASLDSTESLEEILAKIVRAVSTAMEAGVSLVLLDSSQKKLVHTASWGLPHAYLHKGVLDAEKSLGDVLHGQVVVIEDIKKDSRLQFPGFAADAGIAAMLGIPLILEGKVVGGVRVYMNDPHPFQEEDVEFVTSMAHLMALALHQYKSLAPTASSAPDRTVTEAPRSLLQQAQKVVFAHPSEREFARLLDFYHLEWIYEPRSFPLTWEAEKVTEMFTPDFYLPGLELYVELTTLKQSLVTKKNRKLRRLRELYPDIKITLLYKKDFERLLGKYGFGPLVEKRSRSIAEVLFSTAEIQEKVQELAGQVSRDYADRHPVMIGVLRGVFCFMSDLVRAMTIPLDIDFMAISYFDDKDSSVVKITRDIDLHITGRHVILVEDIVDTGMTLSYITRHLEMRGPASLAVCTLLDKRVRRLTDVTLDYIGFEVPDEFLVGYGLDYEEEYRNLPYIGILTPGGKPG